jgi:diguanylate cyclase (GGDEF)-like protein
MIGLVCSLTLLGLIVDLVIRLSDSYGAIVLAVTGAACCSILLVGWYGRTLIEVRRQTDLLKRLQRESSDLLALDRLTTGIQASRSVDAVSEAILTFARDVFPDSAGTVVTRSASQEPEVLATWGTRFGAVERTGSCYAVRDNQTFSSDGAGQGFRCQHVERAYLGPYICFPIKGPPGTAGILHLRYPAVSETADAQRRRSLGDAAASRIGIGLETLELHELLQIQSRLDPLTGLNNRRALFDHASRVHSEAVGDRGAYSVIVADVDRFKALNDSLGHSAGDAILVTFARHIQRHIRSQDFACRYGGEEFVIVMPDASRGVASQRAELMRAALGSLRTSVPGSVWRLSASFGVATFPSDGNSFAEVLRRADEAMYEAKVAGRDRVTSWSQRSRRA